MQFAVVDLRCSDFDMLTYYMLHILYIERFILPSDIATKTFCSGEYMFLSISHIDIVLDMSNEMSNIYNIRNVEHMSNRNVERNRHFDISNILDIVYVRHFGCYIFDITF